MKILVVGGAGAMGMVTARDLAESSSVKNVVIGDLNVEKAAEIAAWINSEKVSVESLDISDFEALVEAMRGVDVVANAAPYHLNLRVTEAALEAVTDIADLGGVYYMTKEQLKLNERAKTAGVTVVLGAGVAPGIADVLAKHGANELDSLGEIHIRYGDLNLEPAKYKWTFRTILEEFTQGPVIYKNGQFRKLRPFSGKHKVRFPEPVGERNCCFALYSGIATLPFSINKEVDLIDCAMSYTEDDEVRIKVLKELGLTSDKPLEIGGAAVSPKEFLSRCAPPPDVRVRDAASISVEIFGEKGGEKTRLLYQLVRGFHEKYGVSALAYLTGAPLSIACQMLGKGEILEKGVLPCERALDLSRFLEELDSREIVIYETVQRSKRLEKKV